MFEYRVIVGVPAFNEEKFIWSTLQSLARQTYTDFLVVISDNASTDNTAKICEEFSRSDQRFKLVIQQENLGAAKNFEWLFENCSSEYFMWLGAHDLIEETYIEKALQKLDAYPDSVLCYSDTQLIDMAGDNTRIKDGGQYHLASGDSASRYRRTYLRGPCEPINNMFRRKALIGASFRAVLQMDRMILCHAIASGPFCKISEPLYIRRMLEDRKPGTAARLTRMVGKQQSGGRRLESLSEWWRQYCSHDKSLSGRSKFLALLALKFSRLFVRDLVSWGLLKTGLNPLNS